MRNRIGYFYFIIINKFPFFIEAESKKFQPFVTRILRIALVTTITQPIYDGRIISSYYPNS